MRQRVHICLYNINIFLIGKMRPHYTLKYFEIQEPIQDTIDAVITEENRRVLDEVVKQQVCPMKPMKVLEKHRRLKWCCDIARMAPPQWHLHIMNVNFSKNGDVCEVEAFRDQYPNVFEVDGKLGEILAHCTDRYPFIPMFVYFIDFERTDEVIQKFDYYVRLNDKYAFFEYLKNNYIQTHKVYYDGKSIGPEFKLVKTIKQKYIAHWKLGENQTRYDATVLYRHEVMCYPEGVEPLASFQEIEETTHAEPKLNKKKAKWCVELLSRNDEFFKEDDWHLTTMLIHCPDLYDGKFLSQYPHIFELDGVLGEILGYWNEYPYLPKATFFIPFEYTDDVIQKYYELKENGGTREQFYEYLLTYFMAVTYVDDNQPLVIKPVKEKYVCDLKFMKKYGRKSAVIIFENDNEYFPTGCERQCLFHGYEQQPPPNGKIHGNGY